MIGDDIRGDIGGAQGADIRGLLVRSGKFRPQDLRGEIQPDGVIDSIADLPAWWVESLLSCQEGMAQTPAPGLVCSIRCYLSRSGRSR